MDDSEIPERCMACYVAESCGGDNQRRKNGWKDCPFPSVQVGPPRISINPWQFEGFLTPAGEYGRITTRRGPDGGI